MLQYELKNPIIWQFLDYPGKIAKSVSFCIDGRYDLTGFFQLWCLSFIIWYQSKEKGQKKKLISSHRYYKCHVLGIIFSEVIPMYFYYYNLIDVSKTSLLDCTDFSHYKYEISQISVYLHFLSKSSSFLDMWANFHPVT